jgi:uncharacterized protein YcbX
VSAVSVTGLAVTPIKGARLHTVDVLDLQRSGARGNRSFYLIDERERMVNGKQVGALKAVDADPISIRNRRRSTSAIPPTPLPFGIYGEVLHGATIRIGDPVELADV